MGKRGKELNSSTDWSNKNPGVASRYLGENTWDLEKELGNDCEARAAWKGPEPLGREARPQRSQLVREPLRGNGDH